MDFKYSALILVILLNFVHDVTCQKKCEKQGVQCTDDCSGIVACIESGADPIPLHTCDANDKTLLCQVKEGTTEATCDAETCTGSGGADIKIICGSVGELPHPTKCGVSVICKDVNKEEVVPEEECKCSGNAYIDVTRPSLPCRSGGCPRQPVKCDSAGKFGKIQEGSDFYYICGKENEESKVVDSVVVFLSDAGVTKNLIPDFRASIAKECEEIKDE